MIRAAVIGTGGVGRAVAKIMSLKSDFMVTGLVDKHGLALAEEGLDIEEILGLLGDGRTLGEVPQVGQQTDDGILHLIEHTSSLDAVVMTIPSIPHDLVASQVQRLIRLGFKGAIIDILDQSRAIDFVLSLNTELSNSGVTYITGAGATPGFLTGIAALAAHSFIDVHEIRIHFGVGISNYLDSDEASLREILAGWRGKGVEWAQSLSRDEIEKILESEKGILEVSNLKHGDDVLLARSGVTTVDRVSVGGCIDTMHNVKPVSTTVKVTGRTFDNIEASHMFTLGDETSMLANTAGPAVGYLARAVELNKRGITGIFVATDVMPKFVN